MLVVSCQKLKLKLNKLSRWFWLFKLYFKYWHQLKMIRRWCSVARRKEDLKEYDKIIDFLDEKVKVIARNQEMNAAEKYVILTAINKDYKDTIKCYETKDLIIN